MAMVWLAGQLFPSRAWTKLCHIMARSVMATTHLATKITTTKIIITKMIMRVRAHLCASKITTTVQEDMGTEMR